MLPERPGDGGHEHVVDRCLPRVGDPLDRPQRHRLPADAMGHVQLALQRAGRVGRRRQQLDHGPGVALHRVRGGVDARGVQERLDPLVRERPARRHRGGRRPGDPRDLRAHARGHGLGGEAAGLAADVGEREHHAGQCDPVGDRMVQAHEQRAPDPVALQEVDVPERLGPVERRGHEVGDQLTQRAPVAGRGNAKPVEVAPQVEIRVVLPGRGRARQALGRPPAEAREALHHAFADDLLRCGPVEWLVEPQDGVDDHEVRRAVHVQPRRVGARHGVPLGHRAHALAAASR